MSDRQQISIVNDTSNPESDPMAQALAAEAAAEAAIKQPVATPDRPTWLPEKFKNPNDMAQAYTDLEKKMASSGTKLEGLDAYAQEFNTNGDLSEESIKKIAAMGIPENLVKAYVDGQKAVLDTNVNAVFSLAGGQENYSQLIDWAGGSLPQDEVDSFNSIIDSGNMNSIRLAVAGLKARYEQSNGSSRGALIQGETTGVSGGAFRSVAEITAAMRDPRYAKDAAYRQDVEMRVGLSNALGKTR
jgi:hypothetical protein